METLEVQEGRLAATKEFAALNDMERGRVLAIGSAARAEIQAARFVTGIRDRLQRYHAHDYPAQLSMASRLAVAQRQPDSQSAGTADQEPFRPATYTRAASLRPKFELPYIATEADLDEWLAALREAARTELGKGNRISL